jgi:hypothetical protein
LAEPAGEDSEHGDCSVTALTIVRGKAVICPHLDGPYRPIS